MQGLSWSAARAEQGLLFSYAAMSVAIAVLLAVDAWRGRPRAWGEVAQNVVSAVMNQLLLTLVTGALTVAGLSFLHRLSGFASWGFTPVSSARHKGGQSYARVRHGGRKPRAFVGVSSPALPRAPLPLPRAQM